MTRKFSHSYLAALKNGGVGVMPTDTIYGIVGSALNKKTVSRIYHLRKRNLKKPMIILIGSMGDLALFGILPSMGEKKILNKLWPGKVSVVLKINDRSAGAKKKFQYLHRGTGTLAFRLPRPTWLRSLLKKTGPLVAPSANVEGDLPAQSIKEAKGYFAKNVDFYVDFGRLTSKPSTLIMLKNSRIMLLRKGAKLVRASA